MHKSLQGEDEPMADINLIPLIDISLVLVIILMVTTVLIHNPGVKVNLPKTVTHEGAPESSKDITIALSATGATFLNGQPMDSKSMLGALKKAAATDRETRVLIKGDRSIVYQKVMDVMDIVRQSGLTHVVLPTDPKAS